MSSRVGPNSLESFSGDSALSSVSSARCADLVVAVQSNTKSDAISSANLESGITWSEEQLFTFLTDPRGTIPGTTMAFAGIADPQQRADVIAYLAAN